MSGFGKTNALALILAMRDADIGALNAVANVSTLDQALVAKKSELRQSLLAVLGASIEADLCPAHALEVLHQTGVYLLGAAMRVSHQGAPVPWGAIEVVGRSLIETVAKGAGRIPSGAPAGSAAPCGTSPTHSDHQTRQ